jgi:hypothetical protein
MTVAKDDFCGHSASGPLRPQVRVPRAVGASLGKPAAGGKTLVGLLGTVGVGEKSGVDKGRTMKKKSKRVSAVIVVDAERTVP